MTTKLRNKQEINKLQRNLNKNRLLNVQEWERPRNNNARNN